MHALKKEVSATQMDQYCNILYLDQLALALKKKISLHDRVWWFKWRAFQDKSGSNICSSKDWLLLIRPRHFKVCVDLRYQLSQAQLKKEEAERELRELGTKTSRQMEKAAQVCLHTNPLSSLNVLV